MRKLIGIMGLAAVAFAQETYRYINPYEDLHEPYIPGPRGTGKYRKPPKYPFNARLKHKWLKKRKKARYDQKLARRINRRNLAK